MSPRLNYRQASPATIDGLSAYNAQLSKTFADPKLKALVELRVSQMNGCAFCVDMHSAEARRLGEPAQRLDCLSVWREVGFYSDRERAAFAWAEAVTRAAETRVPNEVYAEGMAHFSDEELVVLTAIVGVINAWNRIAITFRATPPARFTTAAAATQPQ